MSTTPTASTASSTQTPQIAGTIPFTRSSSQWIQPSQTLPTQTLGTGSIDLGAISLPATGWLRYLELQVVGTATGGTTVGWQPDAPFNVIDSIRFTPPGGSNDVVTTHKGFDLYLQNKYASAFGTGTEADPTMLPSFTINTDGSFSFTLRIAPEFNAKYAFGPITNFASQATNLLYLILAPFANLYTTAGTPPTGLSVSIKLTQHFWTTSGGTVTRNGQTYARATTPPTGINTLHRYSKSGYAVNPGFQTVTLKDGLGNLFRNLIFVTRNSSGARVDTDFPDDSRFIVGVDTWEQLSQLQYKDRMAEKFALGAQSSATTTSNVGRVDEGVYVIPFHALAGGLAGDPSNSNSQILATSTETQLQIEGTWGSTANSLDVLTDSIYTSVPDVIYAI